MTLGRRKGVAAALTILFVGTIIQVVPSVNSNVFLAGRFLVGLGYAHLTSARHRKRNRADISRSNISQSPPPLLITELARPQHRGKLTTMYNTLCGSHYCSLDGIWYNQVYLGGIVGDPCGHASGNASHSVHRHLVSSREHSLAPCQRPARSPSSFGDGECRR